jgi:hypothetical protein
VILAPYEWFLLFEGMYYNIGFLIVKLNSLLAGIPQQGFLGRVAPVQNHGEPMAGANSSGILILILVKIQPFVASRRTLFIPRIY